MCIHLKVTDGFSVMVANAAYSLNDTDGCSVDNILLNESKAQLWEIGMQQTMFGLILI